MGGLINSKSNLWWSFELYLVIFRRFDFLSRACAMAAPSFALPLPTLRFGIALCSAASIICISCFTSGH